MFVVKSLTEACNHLLITTSLPFHCLSASSDFFWPSAPIVERLAGHGRNCGAATVRIAITNVVEKSDVVSRDLADALIYICVYVI